MADNVVNLGNIRLNVDDHLEEIKNFNLRGVISVGLNEDGQVMAGCTNLSDLELVYLLEQAKLAVLSGRIE